MVLGDPHLKKLLLLLLAVVLAVVAWGILRKNEPPKVGFALVKRQTLVSTLPTNGKVEPFEWQAVRAEAGGVVGSVPVQEGQAVAKGAVVATISDPALQADIDAATAKVAEAQANLAALEAGGKPAEFADIENSLMRARFDLEQARKTYASLQRLVEKHAATSQEADAARSRMQQFELEIAGLEKRRGALVAKPDVAAAKARLQDAETALNLARQRSAQSVVHAPIAGVIYGLEVRPGAYVQAGDRAANVGRLDKLRVRVYVDEPELGRVAEGQPVTITWDALPGKQWHGTVEKKPTSIQALGTRQVGEVVCTIENSGRELIPGTNVNAEIRTAVVDNALVIAKETLRHDAKGDYVFVLKDGALERRAVKRGASSITAVQVAEGLADGDAVALPADIPLKAGDRVTAVMQSSDVK
jgi:HlyD family secretion protein